MSYILATTNNKVQWYKFKAVAIEEGGYELLTELDLDQVPQFTDKASVRM
jgi:hypothetical protein